ncbi:MAG: FkbM family methyltransferase [Pseudomonas sp.]
MSFISYAQNFEDVMLWRTLKLFGPGFYIDIGANHPTRDSVTRSLYERGWRGINIEPVLHYYEALCAERPEDVNLCVAVGDEENELVFFESPETGLSTLSLEMAKLQKAAGIPFVERAVKTRTLTSICEEYANLELPLHFLKIDVEGFEEQVLQGMDFQRWRPWVILIESAFNTDPHWKSLILDAGYKLALCDGVNRYYVAEERLELLAPLSLPPNILDDFQLCSGHALSHSVADVQALQADLHNSMQRADLADARLAAIYSSRLWKVAKVITSVKRLLFSK